MQEVSRIAVFYRLISKKIKFPFVVKELSPTLKENINKTANTISLSKNCRGVRRSQQSPGSRCPLTSAAPRWPGGPGILLLLLLCPSMLFHAPSRFLARSQRPDRGGTAAFAVCSRGSPWPCPRCSPSEDHPVLCSSLCCTKPGIMIQKHFFFFSKATEEWKNASCVHVVTRKFTLPLHSCSLLAHLCQDTARSELLGIAQV